MAFEKASATDGFKGILRVEKQPLVSTDFKGDTYSSILDVEETMVNDNMVKIVAWYDNEMGYSHRVVDLLEYMASKER